jgi:hypothetical protein
MIRQEPARVASPHEAADHRARLARARRTRHQARLIADGQTLAAGPWRSDHLAAVVDRNRIRQYQREHGIDGAAEIASDVQGGAL